MELFIEKVDSVFYLNSGILHDRESRTFVNALLRGYIGCLYDVKMISYGEYSGSMKKLDIFESYEG